MVKVMMFPQKKKLPKGMGNELHKIAKNYVETLYATVVLMELEADKPTREEIMDLVEIAFTEGIYEAIEELE